MAGGVNNASFVALKIEIFRIYYPLIKAKLKLAKESYRLAQWLLIEELFYPHFLHCEGGLSSHAKDSSYSKLACHTLSSCHSEAIAEESYNKNKDTSTFSKPQYNKIFPYSNPSLCHTDSPICHTEGVRSITEVSHHIHRDVSASPQHDKGDCHTEGNARSISSKESIQINKDISHSLNMTNFTIKTLKESFLQTGRLDSEYYQGKYEKNERLIKAHKYAKLKDLVSIKKSIEPGSEAYKLKGIPFIRVSNISVFGVAQSEIYLDSKDFKKEELEALYPKKDSILLSKDTSIGISYCVEKDMECVLSGAILRLEIQDTSLILPRYLSLVLNSITTRLQAQRDSGGSVIAHWKISEIEEVLIPLLDSKIQAKIEMKIKKSFALRAESKALLERAKERVEKAISAG